MRLHRIEVRNFRNLKECSVEFRDATFLIGPNYTGKSSLFNALGRLHKSTDLDKEDFLKTYDPDSDDYIHQDEIEIVAEYRNLPAAAQEWLGFRGRVLEIDDPDSNETSFSIKYKKIWKISANKPEIYMQEYPRSCLLYTSDAADE